MLSFMAIGMGECREKVRGMMIEVRTYFILFLKAWSPCWMSGY
jgi:hypothetical protein